MLSKIPSNYFSSRKSYTDLRNDYFLSVEYLSRITKINRTSRLENYKSELDELTYLDNPQGVVYEFSQKKLSAFLEAHQVIQTVSFLKKYLESYGTLSDQNLSKLQSGTYAYFQSGNSDPSRDLFFELQIASRFLDAGFKVDLSSRTDLLIDFEDHKFFVECKRVSSEAQYKKRVKEGVKQLEKRFTKGRTKEAGLVFASVTQILNPELGILLAENTLKASLELEQMCVQFASKHLKTYYPDEIKALAHYTCLETPYFDEELGRLGINISSYFRSFFKVEINQKPADVIIWKRNKYFDIFERLHKTLFAKG